MKTSRLLTGLLLAATCGLAAADASVKPVNGAMVAANGMAVSTFDADPARAGKSVCNGPCAALWPPLMVSATEQPSGTCSAVVCADGSRQMAYLGKPLYFYQADLQAGERSGDNFKEVWHLVKE